MAEVGGAEDPFTGAMQKLRGANYDSAVAEGEIHAALDAAAALRDQWTQAEHIVSEKTAQANTAENNVARRMHELAGQVTDAAQEGSIGLDGVLVLAGQIANEVGDREFNARSQGASDLAASLQVGSYILAPELGHVFRIGKAPQKDGTTDGSAVPERVIVPGVMITDDPQGARSIVEVGFNVQVHDGSGIPEVQAFWPGKNAPVIGTKEEIGKIIGDGIRRYETARSHLSYSQLQYHGNNLAFLGDEEQSQVCYALARKQASKILTEGLESMTRHEDVMLGAMEFLHRHAPEALTELYDEYAPDFATHGVDDSMHGMPRPDKNFIKLYASLVAPEGMKRWVPEYETHKLGVYVEFHQRGIELIRAREAADISD